MLCSLSPFIIVIAIVAVIFGLMMTYFAGQWSKEYPTEDEMFVRLEMIREHRSRELHRLEGALEEDIKLGLREP